MSLPKVSLPSYELKLEGINKKIKFRPYTVGEEKILLMASQSKNNKEVFQATLDVCQLCVGNKINVEELPLFDLEKLIIAIRTKSVGEKIETTMTCPSCEEKFTYNIDFENMKTEKQEDYVDIVDVDDKIKIKLCYPNVKLLRESMGVIKTLNNELIESSIESIIYNDDVFIFSEQPAEEREQFLLSLSAKVLNNIKNNFLEKTPKNVLHIDYTCPKCGHETNRRIDNLIGFFT